MKMKPKGYKGECGQCDFVANSAIKMEQHLLTHGIVLNCSVVDGEATKPRPKKRKGRKRAPVYSKVEVKTEPLVDKAESQQSPECDPSKCAASEKYLPVEDIKTEVEEDPVQSTSADVGDRLVGDPSSNISEFLFAEEMPCHKITEVETKELASATKVGDVKAQAGTTGADVQSGDSVIPEPSVSKEVTDKLLLPAGGKMLGSGNLREFPPESLQPVDGVESNRQENEYNLRLSLSDADSSAGDSSLALNNSFNSSATLSVDDELPLHCPSQKVKKEPIDDSYETTSSGLQIASGLQVTPEGCQRGISSSAVSKTPPDHDYIRSSPKKDEIDEGCIPEGLREEFMMSCVSIKQEEFEKMCSPSHGNSSESGIIVIAPQGEENEMNELCSLVEGHHEDDTTSKQDNCENDTTRSVGNVHGDDAGSHAVDLIKTSVLRSILMGEVVPPGLSSSDSVTPANNNIKGRKMYSMPCMFTSEGKLRLIPASSTEISHYIVVTPAAPGKQPCLFLVAKSKVQNVGPQTAFLHTNSRTIKPQVKRQIFPPSAKLKKARCDLNSVLAKASGSGSDSSDHEKVIHVSNPNPPGPKRNSSDDKTFYCRKESCSFTTKQYYLYQSHVMHCWQDHGFMVCDQKPCRGSFRTKSVDEFKGHCKSSHLGLKIHCCSVCMYLGTSKNQVYQHYAMYHHDMFAPESPFLSIQYNKSAIQKRNASQRKILPQTQKNAKDNNSPAAKNDFHKTCTNPQSNPQSSDFNGMGEKTMSISLTKGLGGITNASLNIINKGIDASVTSCNKTTTSGHYNVMIAPKSSLTPQKVQCSGPTSKIIRELLNHSPKSLAHPTEDMDISYSVKKLEESLEPAAKLLTQTVQAKYLQDLEEKFTLKTSPAKQVINVYVKEEPVDDFDNNGPKSTRQLSQGQQVQVKKEPGIVRNIVTKDQESEVSLVQTELTEHEVTSTQTVRRRAQESPIPLHEDGIENVPESGSMQEHLTPEDGFQVEYFDGTVDEAFVFDDIDQNATSEELFADQLMMQDNVTRESCDKPLDSPTEHSSAVQEGEVEKLLLKDTDGTISEVLLQPLSQPPRQSQRVRKRKVMICNLSCCVNKKRKRVFQKEKRGLSLLKKDPRLDMKLSSKPAVVLIDIMSLVKPMLGLESPIKYSKKQTARKSTAKRSRVIKKSRCSCCAD